MSTNPSDEIYRAARRSAQVVDCGTGDGERAPIDEGRWLVEHREGRDGAFGQLMAAYRAPVYGYLARCGVDPERRDDLFQEIFLRIHRSAARYDESLPLHPWIFTIAANAVRNHQRQRRVRQLVFGLPKVGAEEGSASAPAEPPDPRPDGERRASARQIARWLEGRIGQLPATQRQVVLLACVEHLPLQHIADALEIPLNTVKSNLRRARLTLARDLARHQRGEAEA